MRKDGIGATPPWYSVSLLSDKIEWPACFLLAPKHFKRRS
jgi:hypothetical protein